MKNRIISLILCGTLAIGLLSGCGGGSGAPANGSDTEGSVKSEEVNEEASEEADEEGEIEGEDIEEEGSAAGPEIDEKTITGEGSVTSFIGEPFYDGVIKNEDDALDAIYSVLDFVGGDQSTELVIDAVDGPNEEGTMFYTFNQVASSVLVYGAKVKLMVDKEGKALGLVSSLVPGLKIDNMEWSIDDKEAEEVVKKEFQSDGLKIIEGATDKTLLPLEDGSDKFYYAWVVYSDNIYSDVDTAYLAHYVDESGKYLYTTPVIEPGNSDAMSGSGAELFFKDMEKSSWSGTVKKHDGSTLDIEVPTAIDPETGKEIMADLERKIVCADYSDFVNNDTITARSLEDGFADNELLIYNAFIEIYDFYASTGWVGPDGYGNPTLILLDWVDEEGNPVHNACFSGKQHGFQTFMFNRDDPDGECYDTMAHEFTHAVTTSTMGTNLYKNDYGAINEGMSDIMGNLTELLMDKTTDEEWLIQENGNEVLRSMSNPNEYQQPGFIWDRYYVPQAMESTPSNDNGGVHTNSSLLNLIAYRLNESGMDPVDQFYYWMGVAYMLTPRTDFQQLSEILPWALKLMKFEAYEKALTEAIEEIGIGGDRSFPEELPEGCGLIGTICPAELINGNDVIASFIDANTGDEVDTWPDSETGLIAATLPAGDYYVLVHLTDLETEEDLYLLSGKEGWVTSSEDELADTLQADRDLYTHTLEDGGEVDLELETLMESIE